MYRCNNCGRPFEDELIREEETGVVAPDGFKEIKPFGYCPHCGSDSYNEVNTCPICGEATATKNDDYCEDCIEELINELKLAVARWRIKIEKSLDTVIQDDVTRDLFWSVMERENDTDFITSSGERKGSFVKVLK